MESGYKNYILPSQLVQVSRKLSGKDSTCNARDLGSIPGSGRFPWRIKWQPTALFLPGECHGQKSLVGYSPWGCKESDTTEHTHAVQVHQTKLLNCIKGYANVLQAHVDPCIHLCPTHMCVCISLLIYIQKTKIMASSPIASWQIDGETVETVSDFIFWGSQITADGDCSHEIKRRLLLGRKVMTNLGSILKSRNITLPTKVLLVKAMVFPGVIYGCES